MSEPQSELDVVLDALADMVGQHCEHNGRIDSGCLSANARAIRLLGKYGRVVIDQDGPYRVVFAHWPEEAA